MSHGLGATYASSANILVPIYFFKVCWHAAYHRIASLMGNSRNRNIQLIPSPLSELHSAHLVCTELQQLKEMSGQREDGQSSAVEQWIPLEVLCLRSNLAYSPFLYYRELSCREKWSRCGLLHFICSGKPFTCHSRVLPTAIALVLLSMRFSLFSFFFTVEQESWITVRLAFQPGRWSTAGSMPWTGILQAWAPCRFTEWKTLLNPIDRCGLQLSNFESLHSQV